MKLIRLKINGMTCAVCAGRVEKAALQCGAQTAEVSLTGNFAKIVYDEAVTDPDRLIKAIENAGYGAEDAATATEEKAPSFPWKLLISAILTVVLMYISMGHMIGAPLPSFLTAHLPFALSQAILTLGIVVLNFRYFTVGFKTLFHLSPTMDTLIAVGSGAALIYSAVLTVQIAFFNAGHEAAMGLYYESAAMILTLVSVGKTLEDRAKRRTRSALSGLLSMAPDHATVLRDGKELDIPASELVKDDLVLIRTGDKLPADGVITDGIGLIDESAMTGESVDSEKGPGSEVRAATICRSGSFRFRVTRAGDETAYARILTMVEDASASKAPVARLADKIASIFVPVVMGISLVSFLLWMLITGNLPDALTAAISVLVISCPCALGLATPTAVTCGIGKGASIGIFIKDAATLETARSIDTVVFDKTGTLTEGKLTLQKIVPSKYAELANLSEARLLRIAALLEIRSSHPSAVAIVKAAGIGTMEETADDFAELPGRGVEGIVEGRRYFCGSPRLMNERGIHLSDTPEAGKLHIYLADEEHLLAAFIFTDSIKENAKATVDALRKMNVRCVMLTGDSRNVAEEVGGLLGLSSSDVHAEVLPDGKAAVIETLRKEGRQVAMVGDGINDAPSLAAAQIGIAMGGGRDVAIDASDIVLLFDRLEDIPAALALSRASYRIIKENLFWALIYNTIGIPVAAGILAPLGILLSPMIASAAMSLSSVSVVTNALRLRRWRYHSPKVKS